MSAPERIQRQFRRSATQYTSGSHFNSRSKIETNLEVDDMAMAYGSDTVKILKKYNCSAMVEYDNKKRTIINYDNLEKCE